MSCYLMLFIHSIHNVHNGSYYEHDELQNSEQPCSFIYIYLVHPGSTFQKAENGPLDPQVASACVARCLRYGGDYQAAMSFRYLHSLHWVKLGGKSVDGVSHCFACQGWNIQCQWLLLYIIL